uniref:Uncharacterized protein n=1 Tax=Aegilops tauschii subsp. strangulata TaxID=200361 RepID=A0A453J003_AEGTS
TSEPMHYLFLFCMYNNITIKFTMTERFRDPMICTYESLDLNLWSVKGFCPQLTTFEQEGFQPYIWKRKTCVTAFEVFSCFADI